VTSFSYLSSAPPPLLAGRSFFFLKPIFVDRAFNHLFPPLSPQREAPIGSLSSDPREFGVFSGTFRVSIGPFDFRSKCSQRIRGRLPGVKTFSFLFPFFFEVVGRPPSLCDSRDAFSFSWIFPLQSKRSACSPSVLWYSFPFQNLPFSICRHFD